MVVGLVVVVERVLGFGIVVDGVVQVVEDGFQGVFEFGGLVDGIVMGGGGVGFEYLVYVVGIDQGVQGLGSFFNGFVEGFVGVVVMFMEDFVLGEEYIVDIIYQVVMFIVEVRVDFFFKGGFVEVVGVDGNIYGDGFFFGFVSYVLEDGEGGVDVMVFMEQVVDSVVGIFGGVEDDVDVGGDIDFGFFFEDGGEIVREVQGFVFNKLGFDGGLGFGLGGIGEQVYDDGIVGDGFIDIEEVFVSDLVVLFGVFL